MRSAAKDRAATVPGMYAAAEAALAARGRGRPHAYWPTREYFSSRVRSFNIPSGTSAGA